MNHNIIGSSYGEDLCLVTEIHELNYLRWDWTDTISEEAYFIYIYMGAMINDIRAI